MKLEFTKWEAGHHGQRPEPVEANDVDHAKQIFSAVACAIHQKETIRAKVEDSSGDVLARFMSEDDEVVMVEEPEPGDLICNGCLGFWNLCDCDDDHGFRRMEEDGETPCVSLSGSVFTWQ